MNVNRTAGSYWYLFGLDNRLQCDIAGALGNGAWGCIETTWNNMSDPGEFAAAAAEEQEGGEAPPLAGAGVGVCLMG